MRLWLHRMDAELVVIERRMDEMRGGSRVRSGLVAERQAYKALLEEPRSPWTHSTSEVEEKQGPWGKLHERLFYIGHWASDARRRVRSADRMLRHYDPAKPKLQHLKQRRRGAA